jgi:hypothetical protein
MNWRDKSITPAGQRLDKTRIFGRVTQGVAKSFYRGIQAVFEIDERVGRPKPRLEFLARDHLSRSCQQKIQDLERLILEANANPVAAQFARAEIRFEDTEANGRRSVFANPWSSSRQTPLPNRLATLLYDVFCRRVSRYL